MSLSSIRDRSARPIPAPGAARSPAPRHVAQARREGLRAELLDPVAAARHRTPWLALQARSLEPNPFLDPDVLLAAAQHLGALRRPQVLLIWAPAAHGEALIGVHALARGVPRRRGLARPWTHELVPTGSPLLDRDRSAEAAAGLLGWAAEAGLAGLLFTALAADGPAAAAIGLAARACGQPERSVARWDRAVLRNGPAGAKAGRAALSAKGAKEARRQRRRLAERGALTYASARSGTDLNVAAEHFLALEARGWKGTAGTALLMQAGRTAFTRTIARHLGPRGRCRIDGLALDGEFVAMGVVLSHGDTDFLWKIAYDERLARFSPGVQFVIDLTERQAQEARALTDSCAIPNHPMIDRLWRDRLALADIAVGTGPGFRLALARLRLLRRLRALAKSSRATLLRRWR